MSLDVEIQYKDIQERYRTLAMYNIVVPEEEVQGVECIEEKWLALFDQAKHVDRSLVKVKKKFTIVSSLQLATPLLITHLVHHPVLNACTYICTYI